ncbi:hypothetical protein RGZ1_70 [Morganella phage vB_MmoM_Rgz1]|nr:hypothetical protein RGZ1_70 [Morganella phage vB_MmoM_Rgz1]
MKYRIKSHDQLKAFAENNNVTAAFAVLVQDQWFEVNTDDEGWTTVIFENGNFIHTSEMPVTPSQLTKYFSTKDEEKLVDISTSYKNILSAFRSGMVALV